MNLLCGCAHSIRWILFAIIATMYKILKSELVEKALGQLQAGKEAEKVILELANKLTNRLMHAPTRAIQDAAKNGEAAELSQLKKMLGIDQE